MLIIIKYILLELIIITWIIKIARKLIIIISKYICLVYILIIIIIFNFILFQIWPI